MGEGFVESVLPEEQNPGRKLVLPETIYHLSGKEPFIFVENLTKEKVIEIRNNSQFRHCQWGLA